METLVLLLPIVFIFHDFEEIIFFKAWLTGNQEELKSKFPKLSKRFITHFKNISTASFALGVAEEFILISIISIYAVYTGNYGLWYGIFIAFSFHLIVHFFQWIVYRKYIPCIVTSILVFPYCIYTFMRVNELEILDTKDKIIFGFLGIFIMIVNLIFVHRLMNLFEKRLKKGL